MLKEKLFYWIPRVLSALLTLFFLAFVFEAFASDFNWQDGLSHLIPGLLMLAITIFACKRPKDGGILFMLIGLSLLIVIHENEPSFWIISLTSMVIGVLFYLSKKN